jgi:endonuclease/exonuclease/phosphatase (EEP) superfamily protein YafD
MSMFGILQAAAIFTIGFSLLTGLDIPHRNFELFSHFRLQYFVASILLLIVFAVARHYAYVAALALTVIFNAWFIVPWYFAGDAATGGAALKLIHANVYSNNTNYERMIDFVKTENPDIFFLQEVTSEWVEGTRTLLEDYPYTYEESRHGNYGIAAFSKLPFNSIRHIESPPHGSPTIIATVTFNAEQLTIISSHPTIPVGRQLYEARNEQLESIADEVNQLNGNVVLLGDFNASIWCAHFRQLETSTGLKNVRRGFGILPSWPTYFPIAMIPIDHALVSEDISVSGVRTGRNIGSDHLPLIVTLLM